MSEMIERYDLNIRWGPAWLDEPADSPSNYDDADWEAVTLEEAFEIIRGWSNIIEITLTPAEGEAKAATT